MMGMSFDLSKRNTGYVVWEGTTIGEFGSQSFADNYFGNVLLSFQKWLEFLIETGPLYKPSWIAYEEVMVRNKLHAELHFGMVGILAMSCVEKTIPLIGVNTMRMKKIVTGTGKATKEQMVKEIISRYSLVRGILDINHDIADAIAVGIVAQRLFMKEEDAPHAKVD